MGARITGFGSVWSVRMCRDENDSHRFARSAYYNTTGIVINGKLRRRWTSGGDVRFCGARSGFDPNYPDKAVGRTWFAVAGVRSRTAVPVVRSKSMCQPLCRSECCSAGSAWIVVIRQA